MDGFVKHTVLFQFNLCACLQQSSESKKVKLLRFTNSMCTSLCVYRSEPGMGVGVGLQQNRVRRRGEGIEKRGGREKKRKRSMERERKERELGEMRREGEERGWEKGGGEVGREEDREMEGGRELAAKN